MTDRNDDKSPRLARRGLLTGAGVAVAAVAAVPLLPQEAEAFRATLDQKAARYQDTEHNQRFYALNRR